MAFVVPYKTKISIEDNTISIPGERNWILSIFFGCWLIGWAVGEAFVLTLLMGPKIGILAANETIAHLNVESFLFVWLVCWTIGGVAVWYVFLWVSFGKERISKRNNLLCHELDFLFYTRKREYDLNHISNIKAEALRYNPASFTQRPSHLFLFFGIGGGVISFDYGDGHMYVGAKAKIEEQKVLLEFMRKLFPDQMAVKI